MRWFGRNRNEPTPEDQPGPVSMSRPIWAREKRPTPDLEPVTLRATSGDRARSEPRRRPEPSPARKPTRGREKRKASLGLEYLPRPIQPAGVRARPAPKAKPPMSWGIGHATGKPSGRSNSAGGWGGWFGPIDGSGSGRSGGWSRLY